MQYFSVIEDAAALVRLPKGVYKQTKMYRRGEYTYVPHGGGFIRITGKFGGYWTTSHPDITVAEQDMPAARKGGLSVVS